MKFTDGVEINTEGAYRIIKLHDGYYVTGEGILIPVDSREEAEKELARLKSAAYERSPDRLR